MRFNVSEPASAQRQHLLPPEVEGVIQGLLIIVAMGLLVLVGIDMGSTMSGCGRAG